MSDVNGELQKNSRRKKILWQIYCHSLKGGCWDINLIIK